MLFQKFSIVVERIGSLVTVVKYKMTSCNFTFYLDYIRKNRHHISFPSNMEIENTTETNSKTHWKTQFKIINFLHKKF